MKFFSLFFKKRTPTIFISYRRKDSEGHTGRLLDNLRNYLKQKAVVFRDFDSIPATVNYVKFVQEAIESSSVFITVIGEKWLNVMDPKTNGRRLDNPKDSVRMEIKAALTSKIPIIPVLVDDAQMPNEDDLPDELKELAYINAIEIGEPYWNDKVERLVIAIENVLERPGAIYNQPDYSGSDSFDYRKIIIAGALISIIGIAGLWLSLRNTDMSTDPNLEDTNSTSQSTVERSCVEPVNKCLVDYVLPMDGMGYTTYNREPEGADQYGCASTIRAIQDLAAAWKEIHPEIVIQIGDISRKGGGDFKPHPCHQNGIDFDIRPLRKDKQMGGITVGEEIYSTELTEELISLIKGKFPNAVIRFNDKRLISKGLTTYGVGFSNHITVSLP